MIYEERTGRTAFRIDSVGTRKLRRVPFMSNEFNEEWLQKLIEDNPAIIPSAEVSAEYYPLLCIGREVPVGKGDTKGYIDNLYITPTGKVVIVETKLFRNQESRRTVVAQIIDYAKELQQWDAEMLDAVAGEYFYQKTGQAMRIIDAMAAAGHLNFHDEAAFVDSLNKNLADAAFLLMIVGDGIRSNVSKLADFLNDNTSMSFHLALAEIEVYQDGEDRIIIPNLLTKTTIIERRSYLTPENNQYQEVFVNLSNGNKYVPKPVLSRREFIDVFAARGGYDPDLIAEFFLDVESVSGISINVTPTEIHIDCFPDGKKAATILYFGIPGNREASIYMRPDRLLDSLAAARRDPIEAESFLEFYKDYIDPQKCVSDPYEFGANRFYYAKVGDVLESSSRFVGALEEFMEKVSND